MDVDLTPILEDLAAGRIDTAEANRRIQAVQRGDEQQQADRGQDGPAPEPGTGATSAPAAPTGWGSIARDLAGAAAGLTGAAVRQAAAVVGEQVAQARTATAPQVDDAQRPTGSQGVERLVVRTTGRRVRIVGDPRIGTVSVDGAHDRERRGGTLEVTVESELGGGLDPSRLLRSVDLADMPRILRGQVNAGDLRRVATGKLVTVRVNPAILVDVESAGSAVEVEGLPWLGRLRVTAGSAHARDLVEVEDALVQAAAVQLSGRFNGPSSRVRVESGTLTVQLAANADVDVRGQASMGRIAWPEPGATGHRAGLGTGHLDLGVTLGRIGVLQDE